MRTSSSILAVILSAGVCLTQTVSAEPAFASPETTVYTHESVVIPFSLKQPVESETSWETTIHTTDAAKVLQPAIALPHQSIGYLRILPKQAGPATIRLKNGPSLKLNILESAPETAQMRFISPLAETVLEGQVQVGVDLILSNSRSKLWKKSPPQLHIGSGEKKQTIQPLKSITDRLPHSIRYIYQLDCNELDAGMHTLSVQWNPGNTTNQSISRDVYILNTSSARELQSYPAEDLNEVRVTYLNRKKPQPLPKIQEDVSALNGKYAMMPSNGNALAFHIESQQAAYYQLFARVRSPLAGGAYASMGVYLGDKDEPVTVARTLSSDWHRIALGNPIYIEPGKHICSLRFTNDFYVKNKIDRSLEIDHISILKIPQDSPITKVQARTLTVSFRDVFDGALVQGPITVHGKTDFEGYREQRQVAPEVSLWINGEKALSQYHVKPQFIIPPHALKAGENQLQLKAHHQGRTVASGTQTVQLNATEVPTESYPLKDFIFTSFDPAWDNTDQKLKKIQT